MGVPRPTPIQEINAQILAFAVERLYGIGGNWWEKPWKGDFFCIFWNAYANGYCNSIDSAPKSKRRLDPAEFHINGDILEMHLRKGLLIENALSEECLSLIADLKTCWDEWTFAWRNHPNKIKRMHWKTKTNYSANQEARS